MALVTSENGRFASERNLVRHLESFMHKYPDPNVKVEQNVKLSPIHRKNGRKREIDVLLTGNVAGRSVMKPITSKW